MRTIVLIGFFALTVAGCTMIPLIPSQIDRQEQQLFNKGLDQFSSSNRVDLLRQLQDDYPDSVWAQRAETIILYARELDKRKEQITTQHNENELVKQENTELRQENQQLSEKIEQLKGLLIEQENRPK
jgi:hypothetical protein